jgi:D-glycero-alpha-D-manno-heptose-7-phosphate kinase
VIQCYESGAPDTVGAIDLLRQAAYAAKDAMLRADGAGLAEAIDGNWAAQKQLHPDISNEAIERVFGVAMEAGALAGKANGAGGGGTVTFLAAPGAELRLRQALREVPDCTVLPCQICNEGVRSWVVQQ